MWPIDSKWNNINCEIKHFARTKMLLLSLSLFILFGIEIFIKINQSKYENELRRFAPIMYIWSNWLFTYLFWTNGRLLDWKFIQNDNLSKPDIWHVNHTSGKYVHEKKESGRMPYGTLVPKVDKLNQRPIVLKTAAALLP